MNRLFLLTLPILLVIGCQTLNLEKEEPEQLYKGKYVIHDDFVIVPVDDIDYKMNVYLLEPTDDDREGWIPFYFEGEKFYKIPLSSLDKE